MTSTPTYEDLYDMVHEKHMTPNAMSIELGMTREQVCYALWKNEVPYVKNSRKKRRYTRANPIEEDRLRDMYEVKLMSMREIGAMFGVGQDTVRVWMQKYDITIRDNCTNKRGRIFRVNDPVLAAKLGLI